MNKLLSDVQPTRVRYIVLAWLCSLSMITYIDRVCIMSVASDIQNSLSITQKEMSFAFSAFALAYAIFEVPTGWLGDRLGPRKVLTRIVICWLLFTTLTGCIWPFEWDSGYRVTLAYPSFARQVDGSLDFHWQEQVVPLLLNAFILLLVVRFLFGAGEAGAYPNIAKGTRNWFSYRERGLTQGLVWTFGRMGGAVAPLLVALLALPFGWRGVFVMLGALGFVWLIGFGLWFHDRPEEHPGVNEAEQALIAEGRISGKAPAPLSWKAVLTSPTLWSLSVMYFCSNAGWSFFITWLPAYLKEELKLSGLMLSIASGGPLFCGAVGCLLGGLLTDRQVRVWGRRWGRTGQGVIAYAIGGCFFASCYWLRDSSVLLTYAALCLASFVKDFGMGASWSTTLDIGHRYSGSVAGVMNTIGNFGTVVSPPVVAWLAKGPDGESRWSISLFYYAGMFYLASILWLFVNPRHVIVYAPDDAERLRAEGVLE